MSEPLLMALATACISIGYLAGRIGSWRNLEHWVGDRIPDRAPLWQQPFLLFVLWVFHPIKMPRLTVRYLRGLPLVEPPKRLPAPEINENWAAKRGRKEEQS